MFFDDCMLCMDLIWFKDRTDRLFATLFLSLKMLSFELNSWILFEKSASFFAKPRLIYGVFTLSLLSK